MKIVETLAKAGVPVGVSVSPIVPGMNDEDIGEVLEAAASAGAQHANLEDLDANGVPPKTTFERPSHVARAAKNGQTSFGF